MSKDNGKIEIKLGGIFSKGYGVIARKPLQDNRLTKTARLIYAYLCSYTNKDVHEAFPGYMTICNDLGINKETYFINLKYLKAYGYISVEKREKSNANLYTIELSPKENKQLIEEVKTKELKVKSKSKKYSHKNKIRNISKQKDILVNIPENPEHLIPENPEHLIPENPEHLIPENPEPINNNYKEHLINNNNNSDTSTFKDLNDLNKNKKPVVVVEKTNNNFKNKTIEEHDQINITTINSYSCTKETIKDMQNKFIETLSIYLENGIDKNTLYVDNKTMKKLIEKNGLDKINEYLNNHDTFTIKKNPSGFMIKAINGNWKGTRTKAPAYTNNRKPTQSSNFEQREYDDEFFESLYDNF